MFTPPALPRFTMESSDGGPVALLASPPLASSSSSRMNDAGALPEYRSSIEAELKERTAVRLAAERSRVLAQLEGLEPIPCAMCAREQAKRVEAEHAAWVKGEEYEEWKAAERAMQQVTA